MDLATVKFIGSVIVPVLIFWLSAGVTVGVWYLRKQDGAIEKGFEKLDASIEARFDKVDKEFVRIDERRRVVRQELDGKITGLEQEFNQFRIGLPERYVLRIDLFRHFTILEKRIDAMVDKIDSALNIARNP